MSDTDAVELATERNEAASMAIGAEVSLMVDGVDVGEATPIASRAEVVCAGETADVSFDGDVFS